MRKFKITVDGREFTVTVEEINGGQTTPLRKEIEPRPAAPVVNSPAMPLPAPGLPGTATVSAPMPGLIIDLPVKVGDTVAVGDVVVILEAMKMENEITAPAGGTLTGAMVKIGDSVNTGDPLVTIG